MNGGKGERRKEGRKLERKGGPKKLTNGRTYGRSKEARRQKGGRSQREIFPDRGEDKIKPL